MMKVMTMKSYKRIILPLLAAILVVTGCHKKRDYDYSRWYVDPNEGDGGRKLSTMTFNVRSSSMEERYEVNTWAARRPGVKAMMSDRKPVLMGTQECKIDQREHILADHPEYGAIWADNISHSKEETEECTIFYIKDSVEVLRYGTFYLTSTPDVESHHPATNHYRVCTWGKLKMKNDGKLLYYFNTHLDLELSIQQFEMDVILNKMRTINTENLPIFLTADFNCDEDSNIFGGIKGDGFLSARLEAVVGDSYKTFNGFGYNGSSRLDHCFFKDFSAVTRFTTIRNAYAGIEYISDHYPVSIILKF